MSDVTETQRINNLKNPRQVITKGDGPTGPAHNRNIAAAAVTHPGTDATNTETWTIAENIKQLLVRATVNTPAAVTSGDAFIAVINAPTASIAKAWLEDVGAGLGQDVVYETGYFGEVLDIRRTTPITRIDVLPLNAIMRINIAATEGESEEAE